MKRLPDDPKIDSQTDTADRGFLGRWSRRKHEQREAHDSEPSLDHSPEQPLDESHSLVHTGAENSSNTDGIATSEENGPEPERILTDEDMPPLETLNAESDYSPFFSEGVSKQLRNMALKRLFFSGKFAARDGLDDYDDDFTSFEPLGDTITSDMRYHERRKEKARLAKLEEEQARLDQEAANEDEQQRLEEEEDQNEEEQDIDGQGVTEDAGTIDEAGAGEANTTQQRDSTDENEHELTLTERSTGKNPASTQKNKDGGASQSVDQQPAIIQTADQAVNRNDQLKGDGA